MSPSDHQCCVDTSVLPVDIDFFSCSIRFWAQAAQTFPVSRMEFRDRHGCRELSVGAVGDTTMTGIQIKAARQSQLLRNSGFKELLHLLLHCCICGYPCFIPPALHLSKDRVPPGTSLGTWIVSGLDTRLGTQNSGS